MTPHLWNENNPSKLSLIWKILEKGWVSVANNKCTALLETVFPGGCDLLLDIKIDQNLYLPVF